MLQKRKVILFNFGRSSRKNQVFASNPFIDIFRVDCSGRRVASLDVDGVVKVNLSLYL